jgi:MFS transporter, FSR family, fosmidomycin resistance protein
MFSMKNKNAVVAIYGISHTYIDLVSIYAVFSIETHNFIEKTDFLLFVLYYNVIAFGLQFIIGYMTDKLKCQKIVALSGIMVCSGSLLFLGQPHVTVLLAGLGNAMFHIGGGIASLSLRPGNAVYPGIFVAPGTVGLFLGASLFYKAGTISSIWFYVIAIILCFVISFVPNMHKHFEPKIPYGIKMSIICLIIILILFTISIRALIGLGMDFSWKQIYNYRIMLVLSVFIGKAMGGILAEKFGWIKTIITGLLLSIPLLYLGEKHICAGLMGIFCFNLSMPVTLVAITNLLSGREGFGFGLTTLALVIGGLPFLMPLGQLNLPEISFLILIPVSAIVLFFSLQFIYNKQKISVNKTKSND